MVDVVTDLNHYYSSTIIGKKEGGKIIPSYVLEFRGDNKTQEIIYIPKLPNVKKEKRVKFVPSEWILTFPKVGVFNVNDTVVYIERTIRRQWRKSFRGRLVNIYPLFEVEYDYIGRRNYDPESPDVLNNLYNPSYFSFKEAYDLVDSCEHLGAAFSDEFYLGRKIWSDEPVVGYKQHFVGTTDGKTVFLKKESECLKDSLEQFVPVEVRK